MSYDTAMSAFILNNSPSDHTSLLYKAGWGSVIFSLKTQVLGDRIRTISLQTMNRLYSMVVLYIFDRLNENAEKKILCISYSLKSQGYKDLYSK